MQDHSEIGGILMGKLRQLSGNGGPQSGPDVVFPGGAPVAPTRILETICDLARSAAAQGPQGHDATAGLAADLMGFLAAPPDWIRQAIQLLPSVPPEPASAWEEPSSSTFWRLAALIQDVWEHGSGPETESDPQIIRFLDRQTFETVLDFGSGAGFFAFHLASRGVAVTCIESNPVKRAFLAYRKALRPEGSRISFAAGRRAYDAVLAINVLDHLEDPVAAVGDLARRLRPGGALILRAGFPDDGWHCGSEPVRESLFQELMRHFRHPEPAEDSGDETVLLIRRARSRARPLPASVRSPRNGLRARLDPAVRLIPQPGGGDRFVVAAPRFYVRPLLLTGEGAALTRLCAEGRTVAELRAALGEMGVSPRGVAEALEEMARAHLIVLERTTS
jgi:SAM-dependent methyltransferase